MKKLKLFTALATAGMTTGILLPLVTSCNVAATGEIKFKLVEGITAKADPFKVGDKVVINYKIKDSDISVSASTVTVKFDGWKVQPSKKTYGLNVAKKQITIYNAPTTDITVIISAGSKTHPAEPEPSEVITVTFKVSESSEYYIKDPDGSYAMADIVLEDVASGTYSLNNLFYGYDYIKSNADWTGWVDEDGNTIDGDQILSQSVTVSPTFVAWEPATPGEEVEFYYGVYQEEYDWGKFGGGRIKNSGAWTAETIQMFLDPEDPKTVGDLYEELTDANAIEALPGYIYDGACDENGNPYDDTETLVDIGKVYFKFKLDPNDKAVIAYSDYEQNAFYHTLLGESDCEGLGIPYVTTGDTFTMYVDFRGYEETVFDNELVGQLTLNSGDQDELLGLSVKTFDDGPGIMAVGTHVDPISIGGNAYYRFFTIEKDAEGNDVPGAEYSWPDLVSRGIIGFEIKLGTVGEGNQITLAPINDVSRDN